MPKLCSGIRIALKNVLYLTDFSKSSEAALPVAAALAREFDGTLRALHVILSGSYIYTTAEMALLLNRAQDENARVQMLRAESRLGTMPHATMLVRGSAVWPATESVIEEHQIDVIVLGTHGRTGALKCLLGSVAEEVLRRSPVPVITVGPAARLGQDQARFARVLLATDLRSPSPDAALYALSFAQENNAQLILLHVLRPRQQRLDMLREISVAEAMHHLHELVPSDAELWCGPETIVEYGEPAAKILEVAGRRQSDLIVLGVRDTQHLVMATHFQTTAHKVVANAPCPVLTVRPNCGEVTQASVPRLEKGLGRIGLGNIDVAANGMRISKD